MRKFPEVRQALKDADYHMKELSEVMVTTNHQSVEVNQKMVELLHYSFAFPMKNAILEMLGGVTHMGPNMPWAEDHFAERICGYPINPGTQYKNWPWANYAEDHKTEKFNHNYMERYWPKLADFPAPTLSKEHFEEVYLGRMDRHPDESPDNHMGIRGGYGDLNDVINLLKEDINTRQAYLPIFFPEDTGNHNSGRKPCTLGYHFIVRNNRLDITYYIRSCDFHRHFVDDVYMTIRLAEFVLSGIQESHPSVVLGDFIMHITSLHMFIADYHLHFKKKHRGE